MRRSDAQRNRMRGSDAYFPAPLTVCWPRNRQPRGRRRDHIAGHPCALLRHRTSLAPGSSEHRTGTERTLRRDRLTGSIPGRATLALRARLHRRAAGRNRRPVHRRAMLRAGQRRTLRQRENQQQKDCNAARHQPQPIAWPTAPPNASASAREAAGVAFPLRSEWHERFWNH